MLQLGLLSDEEQASLHPNGPEKTWVRIFKTSCLTFLKVCVFVCVYVCMCFVRDILLLSVTALLTFAKGSNDWRIFYVCLSVHLSCIFNLACNVWSVQDTVFIFSSHNPLIKHSQLTSLLNIFLH